MFASIATGEKSSLALGPIRDYLVTGLEDPEVLSNIFQPGTLDAKFCGGLLSLNTLPMAQKITSFSSVLYP